MEAVLDDIAFLANSANRVAVFETIVESPRTRGEINARVDASRVTIARIIRELEDNNWISITGQEYSPTPNGRWVYDEFRRLVKEIQAERRLRRAVQWLPTDLLSFDIRCLRDAELILLESCDTTALTRRVLEFHRSGSYVRGIARESAPEFIENQWELSVQGDTEVDLVITSEIVASIRDHPPTARYFREMLEDETANANYHVYDDIPLSVGIVNGEVGLNLIDEHGTLKGGLKIDNEIIHEWAVKLFETYRQKARPVEVNEITT